MLCAYGHQTLLAAHESVMCARSEIALGESRSHWSALNWTACFCRLASVRPPGDACHDACSQRDTSPECSGTGRQGLTYYNGWYLQSRWIFVCGHLLVVHHHMSMQIAVFTGTSNTKP